MSSYVRPRTWAWPGPRARLPPASGWVLLRWRVAGPLDVESSQLVTRDRPVKRKLEHHASLVVVRRHEGLSRPSARAPTPAERLAVSHGRTGSAHRSARAAAFSFQ